jgi:hypothetical protein
VVVSREVVSRSVPSRITATFSDERNTGESFHAEQDIDAEERRREAPRETLSISLPGLADLRRAPALSKKSRGARAVLCAFLTGKR